MAAPVWKNCSAGWSLCRCQADRGSRHAKPIWTTKEDASEVSEKVARNGPNHGLWVPVTALAGTRSAVYSLWAGQLNGNPGFEACMVVSAECEGPVAE